MLVPFGPSTLDGIQTLPLPPVGSSNVVTDPFSLNVNTVLPSTGFSTNVKPASPVGEVNSPLPLLSNTVCAPLSAVRIIPPTTRDRLCSAPKLRFHCDPRGPSLPCAKCRDL